MMPVRKELAGKSYSLFGNLKINMSKIAKKPIDLKDVNATVEKNIISITGPKGNLSFQIPNGIDVKITDNVLRVSIKTSDQRLKALSGLTRATIANLVKGVTEGFQAKLELTGVGYRVQGSGDTVTLSLGFSHPIIFKAVPGITFTVEENIITIAGVDKMLVGNTAAKIRSIRPPEPYKGKGIKYVGERIRRKVGKAAKAVAGAGAGAK